MQKAKRVGLSLSPDVDLVLTKLSQLTGQPKTGIINEILEDSLPIFQQVIKALEEAKAGQLKMAIETTARYIAETSGHLQQVQFDLGILKGKHGK